MILYENTSTQVFSMVEGQKMDHINFHHISSSHLVERQKERSDVTETVDEKTSLAPATSSPPRRLSSNYKVLLDFSQKILPDLRALLRRADTICPEQCEQAIANMKMQATMLEKQKAALHTSSTVSYESDECAILRCKLDVALAYAGELTQKLIRSFSALQTRCHSQSKQTTRSQEEIAYYLTLLSHHYDGMLQKIRTMNMLQDQLRFHRKRITSSIDDVVSL